jgi:hypothetical protein
MKTAEIIDGKIVYPKLNPQRQAYQAKYYKTHKDLYVQHSNCVCGGKWSYGRKDRHIQSKKHQKWTDVFMAEMPDKL